MSVDTVDTLTPWLESLKAELEKLARAEIRVGILSQAGGEMLMIANVHEFGCTIKPKTAKNLAIPLKPECKDKSPRDFPEAFATPKNDEGNRFIARRKNKKGDLELLFLLLPKVTIPERSFIRAGYDANKNALAEAAHELVGRVVLGELTAEQVCNNLGRQAVAMIQEYMDTVTSPKSSLTLASAPGKTSPLVQSGRLRNSISFEVNGL